MSQQPARSDNHDNYVVRDIHLGRPICPENVGTMSTRAEGGPPLAEATPDWRPTVHMSRRELNPSNKDRKEINRTVDN